MNGGKERGRERKKKKSRKEQFLNSTKKYYNIVKCLVSSLKIHEPMNVTIY
jgi:hypothetical protein